MTRALTDADYKSFGYCASAAESIGMRHLAQQYRIAGCKGNIEQSEYALLTGRLRAELMRHIPRLADDAT